MLGPADQDIRLQANGPQLFHAVLGWFGFQFARRRQIRQQGQVHQDALAARAFRLKLANGFEEWQAFDVTNGAADLTQHEIDVFIVNRQPVFDFIRHMGNHLDRLTEVIAIAFLIQNVGVDPARRHTVGLAAGHAGKSLVVPKVQIRLSPVIGDEHLAMLKRAHRAGIDIQIRVKFAKAD